MFSIIIPSLNEGYYLNLTLDSIYNYSNVDLIKEIIIVDDYSDKEDYGFLENHVLRDKIKLIKNTSRKGPSYSRNIGAKNANGDILIFLDAHMYCYNLDLYKLKSLESFINKGALQGTIGDISNKNIKGQIYKIDNFLLNSTWMQPLEDNSIVETTAIAGGFTIISKKVFKDIGGFNKKFNSWGMEDIELSFRLWSFGYDMYYTDEVGVAHYFKQKFNYEVNTEDVLYNKYITYKIYFEDSLSRKTKVIEEFEKQYGKELLEKTILLIESNDKIMNFINKYKSKQKRSIDDYFTKFTKYYEKL